MKISDLLTEAKPPGAPGTPAAPIRYVDPPGIQGQAITLNQRDVEQIVKAQKLVSTQQSAQRIAKSIVNTPVVMKVGGQWQVVSGHDDIASLASLPNPKIKAIAIAPGTPVPGQQSAAAQSMTKQAAGNKAQQPPAKPGEKPAPKGPGIVSRVKTGYKGGSAAANNVVGAISGTVNKVLGTLGGNR